MRKLSDLRLQIRRITEWNVPELRARLEIDRDDRTPRRRRARDAARTLHDPPAHHVRRAMHARVLLVQPRSAARYPRRPLPSVYRPRSTAAPPSPRDWAA